VTLDDGVYEFTYGCFSEEVCVMDAAGEPAWICSRERIQISPEASIFSAANLRATQDLPQYADLVDYWGKNAYSLRYTGAIVSDICQQFTKKQGVFSNPASPKSPAKLPLAYAALPFGHMVEKAGGKTSDGMTGGSILDVKIDALDQRTALCIGSAHEVERFNEFILRDGPSSMTKEASEQYFPEPKNLETVLEKKLKDKDLRSLYYTMFNAFGTITEALRNELVTVADKQNSQFGDIQLGVDVLADDLMWDVCKADPLVKDAASEEEPEVRMMHEDGKYSIVWDPLDGSSIIDNNWAVGTIIGIWPASTGIIGATGRDQVSSMVALYGPRTQAYVTLDDGVYEFTYGEDGWICSKEKLKIEPESEIFSWGNVKAAQGGTTYGDLIKYWMENRYTLRVSGGLVPDICQQFTKGRGVFAYPATETAPAKLRLAFEAAPFANLVEKSGGKSSDGVTGGSILDVVITGIDQRSPLCMGSSVEVDRFNKVVLGK
jgi:sedoheptulose-bisphosphatase